jgi:hypothetical protein
LQPPKNRGINKQFQNLERAPTAAIKRMKIMHMYKNSTTFQDLAISPREKKNALILSDTHNRRKIKAPESAGFDDCQATE